MEWRLCVDQASLGNWCEVEGFEMSSVRLLGRMLVCFGWREWDFRGGGICIIISDNFI